MAGGGVRANDALSRVCDATPPGQDRTTQPNSFAACLLPL